MDVLIEGVAASLFVLAIVLARPAIVPLFRGRRDEVAGPRRRVDLEKKMSRPDLEATGGRARSAVPAADGPVQGVRKAAASAACDRGPPRLDSDDPVAFAMAELPAKDWGKDSPRAASAGGSLRETPATRRETPATRRCCDGDGAARPSAEGADAVFGEGRETPLSPGSIMRQEGATRSSPARPRAALADKPPMAPVPSSTRGSVPLSTRDSIDSASRKTGRAMDRVDSGHSTHYAASAIGGVRVEAPVDVGVGAIEGASPRSHLACAGVEVGRSRVEGRVRRRVHVRSRLSRRSFAPVDTPAGFNRSLLTAVDVRSWASSVRISPRAGLVETPGQAPLYRIEGVTKRYGKGAQAVYALRDVSLEIGAGVTAITGPNGSGKTTLLHILGALDVPTEGEVLYRGKPLPFGDPGAMNRFRARVPAFVLQDLNLFQDHSAVENVAFSLTRYGGPHRAAVRAAYEQLESLGIDRKQARRLPRNLSGGQRQRVAIARALLANRLGGAEVILADEPTASVDSNDAERVFRSLLDLAHEQAVPVIVVTHNPALAELADRVLLCEHGTLMMR